MSASSPDGHGTKLSLFQAKANVGVANWRRSAPGWSMPPRKKVAGDFFNAFNAHMKAANPRSCTAAAHTDEAAHPDHDEHHPEPVPRDPDLPRRVPIGTLSVGRRRRRWW